MKYDPRIRDLLDHLPDPPDARDNKEELLEYINRQHDLLLEIRRVLINVMANGLLIIGEKDDGPQHASAR